MESGKVVVTSQPPPYSMDILAPPQWNGPPGQLLCYNPVVQSPDGRFSIYGTDSQVLQVTLQPGEYVQAQPGTLLHKAENVKMNTSAAGCFKRCLGGQNLFQNHWINQDKVPCDIAISPAYPAKIIAIDLSRCGGAITLHPGSYMCHIGDVHITYKFVRNLGAACFGGAGFMLVKVTGSGIVFVTGGGTIMEKILAPDEKLQISTECLVGFAETAKYEVVMIPGCFNCCCGGEGLFNTQIVGPGLVIVESMALGRLRKAVAPAAGGGGGGGGDSGGGGGGN